MFGLSFNANRCKIQCQQCKHRIKLLRNKKQILLQSVCTEVANLQREGKGSMAWIRLEAVIQVDNMLRALEILELYVEMLSQRTALLSKEKEIPVDMRGAISSIVFASTRIQELPELKEIRNMMQSKYGRKYVQEVSNENTVVEVHNANEQLVQSLIVTPPSENAKFDRLREICGTFQVDFNESQIMNEHDLCQPVPARAANHTTGSVRSSPEPQKIAGVDYIEQHFGGAGGAPPPREMQHYGAAGGAPRELQQLGASLGAPRELQPFTSTLHRTSDGGIEIPSSPDSLCGDELPAPPGAAPAKRFPETTSPRSPLSLASASQFGQPSAAPPLAADGFRDAREAPPAPAASALPAPGAPKALSAPPSPPKAPPGGTLPGTHSPRHLSAEEYAAAVEEGVKRGIEIAMQAALPYCIPRSIGDTSSNVSAPPPLPPLGVSGPILESASSGAQFYAGTPPGALSPSHLPLEAIPGPPSSAALGADVPEDFPSRKDGGQGFDAHRFFGGSQAGARSPGGGASGTGSAVPEFHSGVVAPGPGQAFSTQAGLPSPPPSAALGANLPANYPHMDDSGQGFDATKFFNASQPDAANVAEADMEEVQRAYDAAPGPPEKEHWVDDNTYSPATSATAATWGTAPSPAAAAGTFPDLDAQLPTPPPNLPSVPPPPPGPHGPLRGPGFGGGGPTSPTKAAGSPTRAPPAAVAAGAAPPPPHGFLRDLSDLPLPPGSPSTINRNLAALAPGVSVAEASNDSLSELSALPSPPMNLPSAPTLEVLPSPSTAEHHGMSFKRRDAAKPESNVQGDLMDRFNKLRHSDV